MISPFCRNDTVEIVVPNSKCRQCVAVKKSKIYASVANGSHPSTNQGGGKRRAVTVSHRLVWPEPADTALSRKNRTHNNRRVLALGEHRILYSHRKFGRHSTASVRWPRVRSAGRWWRT